MWLVVNEAVLSDTEKAYNAYVTNQAILNEAYGFEDSAGTIPKLTVEEMERRWEYIRAQSPTGMFGGMITSENFSFSSISHQQLNAPTDRMSPPSSLT